MEWTGPLTAGPSAADGASSKAQPVLLPVRRWRWGLALAGVGLALLTVLGVRGMGSNRGRQPADAPAPAPSAAAPGLEVEAQVDEEALRRGVGRLIVAPIPLATVWVDEALRGDSPLELELPEGRHLLRAANDGLGRDQLEVNIEAGRRHHWRPKLQR